MCRTPNSHQLSELSLGTKGRILSVGCHENSDHIDERVILRLSHLGFLPDQEITVTNVAPIVAEPILVKVSQGYIALTRQEAALISVEEV
ncbi:MAG: FeoA family protein [bacterium]|nr:FeoA family protein [bacterium]